MELLIILILAAILIKVFCTKQEDYERWRQYLEDEDKDRKEW